MSEVLGGNGFKYIKEGGWEKRRGEEEGRRREGGGGEGERNIAGEEEERSIRYRGEIEKERELRIPGTCVQ